MATNSGTHTTLFTGSWSQAADELDTIVMILPPRFKCETLNQQIRMNG